jgi:hypothetical protein
MIALASNGCKCRSQSLTTDNLTTGQLTNLMIQLHYRQLRLSLLIAACFLATSCNSTTKRPPSDEDRVISATLALLASGNARVCVDSSAKGRPLSVFRTMMTNRPAGLTPPAWYVPEALRPLAAQSRSNEPVIVNTNDELGKGPFANRTAVLPANAQAALNGAAATLAREATANRISIPNSPAMPRVRSRWWVLNRISRMCRPVYDLSTPVISHDASFISVTTDRSGTTYAFSRLGNGWVARAQWTNWLY